MTIKKRKYLFFISQDYSFPILRPLQEEILKRGDEVRWFLYGDEIDYNKLHSDENRVYSVDDIKKYNPDAVFVPGNVVPSFIPGKKIKISHGLPSKKSKNGVVYHFTIRGMFDLYCTESSYSTKRFKELAKEYKTFCVKETGWPKLDPLFDDLKTVNDEKKRIFFASTFSPKYTKAKFLYPTIRKLVESGKYDWYITLHPKMQKDTIKLYKDLTLEFKNATFIDSTKLIKPMKNADLMICDTSSVMYEFLVQLKPVIAFKTHIKEPYLYCVDEQDKLKKSIEDALENRVNWLKASKDQIKAIYPYRDSNSSSRVLDAVCELLDGKISCEKSKPLNIIRNFKLRKELNYWKFW